MGFPVPLTGFAKAYDGAPVDNAKYEESRRQLMEVFRKRQAELAAKAAEAEQNKEAQPARPPQAAGSPRPPMPPRRRRRSRPSPRRRRHRRETVQDFRRPLRSRRGGLSLVR